MRGLELYYVRQVIEGKRRERDLNSCSLGEDSLLSSDEKNSAADSFKTFYKHDAPNHRRTPCNSIYIKTT